MKRRCDKCLYWKQTSETINPKHGGIVLEGNCRRRSPNAKGFPRTLENQWCGEFEEDKNAA